MVRLHPLGPIRYQLSKPHETVPSHLIRRTFQSVITLWVIWSLVFVAYFVAPGDPAAELCRPGCPVWVLQEIRMHASPGYRFS
jgi:ABC-type dipeptide/oligopeptide/nickel transport system permease component